MVNVMIQPNHLLTSRKVVNAIYLLVPPLGLLMMFLSPFYSTRERLVRTVMTASFIALFAVMGPEMREFMNAQLAELAMQ